MAKPSSMWSIEDDLEHLEQLLNGGTVRQDVLQKTLSLQEDQNAGVHSRLDEFGDRLDAVTRMLDRLFDELQDQGADQQQMAKAMGGLAQLVKRRTSSMTAPAAVSPVIPPLHALGQMTRQQRLAKAIEITFPQGAQKVLYSKERAANLLAKGALTPVQHKLWKTTGLLPKGVDVTGTSRGLVSRPL